MMSWRGVVLVVAVVLALGALGWVVLRRPGPEPSLPGRPIERASVEQMFAQATTSPHYRWDITGPCRWGFYFTDPSPEKLAAVVPALEAQGYQLVGPPYELEAVSVAGAPLFVLHVEKVEQHTVDSLDRRNDELFRFAQARGLYAYDGMDVGAVSGGLE